MAKVTAKVASPSAAEAVEVFKVEADGLATVILQPTRYASGQPIESVRWYVYERALAVENRAAGDNALAVSRKQVTTLRLPVGKYYAHLDIYYKGSKKVSWGYRFTVKAPRGTKPTPEVPVGRLTAADARALTANAVKRKTEIKAFTDNVFAVEGIIVRVMPIPNTSFTGAIKALYSHHFPKPLSGKRSVVKQLLARLTEVLDVSKVTVEVVWPTGVVAEPQTHLSAMREL